MVNCYVFANFLVKINLDEQEHEHFKQVLEYMYTGSTDFIDSKYEKH